jgi:asparagine synthase (glutamine-hydrolysing)
MSAIFGKFNKNPQLSANEGLELMERTLNHWQADKASIWHTEGAGLGNLLLHNTPESLNEELPLWHPLSGMCITADARIDNREDIYTLLHLQGPERNCPDSKLILLLYEKFGENCVHHLIGDFAFAIWDSRKQSLFCARDHMGVKPFFYYHDVHHFVFASEKKGILCLPQTDAAIDLQFFYNQVLFPVVQAEDTTLYQHIRRLPPAHTLTYTRSAHQLKLSKYWDLNPTLEINFHHEDDYFDGLRSHFEQAVKCRLRSAYPIGCEVSGGLDSSAITGAASHFLNAIGQNVVGFSNVDSEASLKHAGPDRLIELPYVEDVIKFNNISNYVFVNKNHWQTPQEEVEFTHFIHDGLEARTMMWQTGMKAAAQQNNVRVLLSGFPGDEMVTYQGQFYFMDYLDEGKLLKYLNAPKVDRWTFSKLKPLMPIGAEYLLHKLKNITTAYSDNMQAIPSMLQPPLKYRLSKSDVAWQSSHFRERYKSHRHFQKYRLLKPEIPLRMEAETRLGLHFRVEPRFPMADIRLCQYFLSLPNRLKSGTLANRGAYRKAVAPYLPQSVLQRTDKRGNVMPFLIDPARTKAWEDALSTLLSQIALQNRDQKANSHPQHFKYLTIHYFELLHWWSKNFENLNK